jgi:hybrid polyketide synthase/nonribosomal peptide synthetase ACE1
MPPIVGVVQGAMVLRDTAIRDMTFDEMMEVLMPRVYGSIHLDKLFWNEKLDLFVLLSSMTGVVGNIGQANYAASNTFMASLASNRRKRGLAASVINVGAIIGAGYVTREVTSVDSKRLHREGMTWLSEEDFHQMFAEAVFAGDPDSQHAPEISTGLCKVSIDSLELPTWHNDPKFSKFIVTNSHTSSDASKERPGMSIHQRLQSAITRQEIFEIIRGTWKLRSCFIISTLMPVQKHLLRSLESCYS